MVEKIIKAKLLAERQSNYTQYVFQDIENNEYIMCTKLPNWLVPEVDINDIGFLKFQEVIAGEKYYNPNEEGYINYKYSGVYFINFIRESNINKTNLIL